MNKFDMSADTVTLDLAQLKQVLGSAIATSRDNLENYENDIRNDLEAAWSANRAGNTHGEYSKLCHANTAKEWMLTAANQYAAAIEAYFHVCEALKRSETKLWKGEPGGKA